MWELDGRTFVRFAARLVYYAGAVQGKLKADYSTTEEDGSVRMMTADEVGNGPSTKMSMSDAMKKYGNADDFDVLNKDSNIDGMGDLFERVTVPAT